MYGVSADAGIPVDLPGLRLGNVDAEKLRLENLIRDSIQPRIIPSVVIRPIQLSNNNFVFVLRIPRGLGLPHAVAHSGKGAFSFYSRNSAGKYPMDISEVRNSFLATQQLVDQIREFRRQRLALVRDNVTPLELGRANRVHLHVVPYRAFDAGVRYDLALLEQSGNVRPMASQGWSRRYNFDGLLCWTQSNAGQGYVQVFRNGAIEAVDTTLLGAEDDSEKYIPSTLFERELIDATGRFRDALRTLNVDPPMAVMVTLTGVEGYLMGVSARQRSPTGAGPVDRRVLLVPEVVIEDFDANVEQALRPVFDAVWNAAGWPRSLNYDGNGNWRAHT